ncbi:SDR family oxidoreductase [Hymenobacter sp. CRA2]|uniref:SDR family oxidoreductase n=1 Tax=Hymenobacter sp. CRA2 TaxID=1955620 RepID=UPI0009900926|nr:SDR family oxidoreductase [Hymenobacter sp. CRA2]OON69102.1 short-chain dehydrogenase [Hymenobacter sp. CRA2]
MATKLKPLKQQILVITGASSGIGLLTAQMAAAQGAKVVLAARNHAELQRIEEELRAHGHQVVAVAADVASQADVARIAETAVEHFGGFDTWINDAGVSIWGRLEEGSDEDHRRLFDTNYWGVVYGSLTAARQLKNRGGAIINVGSVASDVALPLQGMYSASKHAVKGFTDALRMELEEEGAPVSVTLIKPAAINTPFPQHARNYMKEEPKLPPPVYAPEEVAKAILHAAAHPERDVFVGGGGKVMSSFSKHLPRAMDKLSETVMVKEQKRDERPRNPRGALHQPGQDGQVHGDHPGYVMKTSLYTRANRHPVLTATLLAAATGAATWWLGRRRTSVPATPPVTPAASSADTTTGQTPQMVSGNPGTGRDVRTLRDAGLPNPQDVEAPSLTPPTTPSGL